ncbi:MAG: DUF1292 domain-containing protein [Acholeplasmataceae bacterium]|nr:DUF1292 domain-containing protein [Acholeplasmataceae bacterium]
MDNNKLTLIDEDGKETICEIILTHEHNGKSYVIFEFAGTEEISAAEFIPDPENPEEGTFQDITTDEEWEMLDKVLDQYFDELDLEEDEE